MTKCRLALEIVDALEHAGIKPVYLRNYENLPQDIGNDVDLLVSESHRKTAENIVIDVASKHGWVWYSRAEFSPVALYFACQETQETLHVDLFDRIEWHWCEYADSMAIMGRREWNGLVHVPHPLDEITVNVLTRLLYHGVVRDKHRDQSLRLVTSAQSGKDHFFNVIKQHCGHKVAARIAPMILEGRWDDLERSARRIKILIYIRCLLERPGRSMKLLLKYISRSIHRIMRPPGMFFAFEGAPSMDLQKIIDEIKPFFVSLGGRSDILQFQSIPTKKSIELSSDSSKPPTNHSKKNSQGFHYSYFRLIHFWLGTWFGYLRYVWPALAKKRIVIANHYTLNLTFSPNDQRTPLQKRLVNFVIKKTPPPNMAFILSAEKILSDNSQISGACSNNNHFMNFDPEQNIDDIVLKIKKTIIAGFKKST